MKLKVMFIHMKIKYIFYIPLLLMASCTWLEVLVVSREVLEHYPADNPAEQSVDRWIDEELDLEEGTTDISFWNDNDDKGWDG